MHVALLCAALLCGAVQDSIRVSATLSSPHVNVGATTTLRVTVETRGETPDRIDLPDLPLQLEVLGSSDFSQTQISIPGGRSLVTRREVILLARAPGVYRIPPVVVRVGGGVYRTAALELTVTGATVPGGFGSERAEARSTLRVLLRPDTVFVGEQVLLFAEATFAEDFRSRQSRAPSFDPPAPTGFWIQDLPDPITVSLRVREGRTVETQTYRRAYFPLSAGEYRFPPARLHYEVRRGFLYAPEARELVSDSVPLVVRPLPVAGRPSLFNGAVGRLSLEASVSPAVIRVGEAAVLSVSITGTGNVRALPEPRLPEIPGVEIFPPTQQSHLDVNDYIVGGSKEFRWVIVPEAPGPLVIPPIEYGVFDPERRAYVVLRSDSLSVSVAPTVATVETGSVAPRGLRTAPGRDVLGWTRAPGFAVIQVVPLLLLAAAAEVRRRRTLPPRPRDIARDLHGRVAALRESPGTRDFLAELEKVIDDALVRVAGIERDAPAQLRARSRPTAAAELEALRSELHRLRYAPAQPYDPQRLCARVDAFIESIIPRSGWRGGSAGPALLAIVLTGGVVLAAGARADDAAFHRAVEHYRGGDYVRALDGFSAYAESRPHDPNGWYDLGLAAWHAGDTGRASWAWLRTVRLAPRDADARHNLRAAGATAALHRVTPFDWLSTNERRVAISAGWWLLTGVAAGLLLRTGRLRPAVLAPGAVILAFALAGQAATALRTPLVVPVGGAAMIHASPTTRDAAVARLDPGQAAEVVEEREYWIRVRVGGGREGWIERGAVASP